MASRTPGRLPRPEKTSHSVRLIDESIGDNPHAAEGLRRKKKASGRWGRAVRCSPLCRIGPKDVVFQTSSASSRVRSGERMQKADGHAALDAGRGRKVKRFSEGLSIGSTRR